MFGMLFGEIERTLSHMGFHPKNGTIYSRFILAPQKDLKSLLMNIEGFLDALEFYHKKADKLKVEDLGPPEDVIDRLLPIWQSCLNKVDKYNNGINKINIPDVYAGKMVLQFVLDSLKNRKLKSLPKGYSDMILDSKTRDRLCNEYAKNGHAEILSMVNAVHHIEEQVTKQSMAMASGNKEIKFKNAPQIDIDVQDLPTTKHTSQAPHMSKPTRLLMKPNVNHRTTQIKIQNQKSNLGPNNLSKPTELKNSNDGNSRVKTSQLLQIKDLKNYKPLTYGNNQATTNYPLASKKVTASTNKPNQKSTKDSGRNTTNRFK